MRTAIYARYSSELQSPTSIDDQVRICRARAERDGWDITDVYADAAATGSYAGRENFQKMLMGIRAGRYDLVLTEDLDRISRDLQHIAGFYKEAKFAGTEVVTLADGVVSDIHIGIKGTMSVLFLKGLAEKTHRGLEGRVLGGYSAGGRAYGYRVRRGFRPDGGLITGEMEIVPDEAAVVRRVCEEYARGKSPRAIAKTLNAEHIPGPLGGTWTHSSILGHGRRETGILRNRLYIGERVWNRQRYIRHPLTAKLVSRPNPPEVWIRSQVPHLRIIDESRWQAVQARLQAAQDIWVSQQSAAGSDNSTSPPNTGARLAAARRPPWLLARLVRCGICGAPMTVVGCDGRLGCFNHVARGTCSNRRTLLRDALLRRVLVGLKERLLAPELVEEFVRAYITEANAANRDRGAQRARLLQEHAKVGRQTRNLLELIKDGHGSPAMVRELRELERCQEALATECADAQAPEPVPVPHPNLPEIYRRKVEALEEALRDPATAMAATEALRGLIDAILIYPGEKRGEVDVQLRGDLAAFLHLGGPAAGGAENGAADSKTAVLRLGNGRSHEVLGTLVAGTGYNLYRTDLQWARSCARVVSSTR